MPTAQRASRRQVQPREPLPSAGGPDAGASEVIGSILTATITIGMAVTLAQFTLDLMPAEKPPSPTSLEATVHAGDGGWGTGDETLTLLHTGGASLPQNDTTLHLTHTGTTRSIADGELTFPEGRLALGDRWTLTLDLPADTRLDVNVVRHSPSAKTIAAASPQTGPQDCSQDAQAPAVDTWTQRPSTLRETTEGPLEVTATLQDDCSGPDPSTTPHLRYKLTGSDTYDDAGPMTALPGHTWQGEIPEPEDGWEAHADETLTYRLDPLQDRAGNAAPSKNQTPAIQPAETQNTILYPASYHAFSGYVESFQALQNATDGEAATLREQATEPNATTSEAYGTAHSSSNGATDPGAATGSPGGGHATLASNNDWVGIEGFQTFTGEILSVDIALQGHYEGTPGAPTDQLELAYRVGTTRGDTTSQYGPQDLPQDEDADPRYLNVTQDREWSWSDLADLQIRATYLQDGSPDDLQYNVNALWLRVAYDNPAYNASIQFTVPDIPPGDHEIKLRYAVSDETHRAEAWNYTTHSWDPKGSDLTRTTPNDWTAPLSPDQIKDGEVRFRILDAGPDHRESTLDLHHAGVRSR